MYSSSRFIAAAVAALGVSVVSAGFLAARRATHSNPPAASTSVSAEPTPAALPSPVASPQPVATPAVESADAPVSTPAHVPETVLTKAVAPRPAARAATKPRTPAPAPARAVEAVRPATSPVPSRPAPAPALEPVAESRVPAPPVRKPAVDVVPVSAPPPATVVETAPIEIPRPQAEAPRPQLEEYTVRADSVLGIRLDQSLSSATARLEDRVTASVSRDVIVNGRTVVPSGTRLEGNVALVQPGGKFKGRARLGIRFHTLVLADGMRVPIQTETLYRDGESATGSAAAKVGTGAAAGTILGAVLGGKRGAIIGAGVGAAGGTAAVIAGDAKDAVLESGVPLTVRITSPVTLTIER